MIKSNIYLTDRQRDVLETIAQNLGIKRSEYIRRVLDEHIEKIVKENYKEMKNKIWTILRYL